MAFNCLLGKMLVALKWSKVRWGQMLPGPFQFVFYLKAVGTGELPRSQLAALSQWSGLPSKFCFLHSACKSNSTESWPLLPSPASVLCCKAVSQLFAGRTPGTKSQRECVYVGACTDPAEGGRGLPVPYIFVGFCRFMPNSLVCLPPNTVGQPQNTCGP